MTGKRKQLWEEANRQVIKKIGIIKAYLEKLDVRRHKEHLPEALISPLPEDYEAYVPTKLS